MFVKRFGFNSLSISNWTRPSVCKIECLPGLGLKCVINLDYSAYKHLDDRMLDWQRQDRNDTIKPKTLLVSLPKKSENPTTRTRCASAKPRWSHGAQLTWELSPKLLSFRFICLQSSSINGNRFSLIWLDSISAYVVVRMLNWVSRSKTLSCPWVPQNQSTSFAD